MNSHVRIVARATILAFVVLATYDGALRKWVLPSLDQPLFLAKDVVLLAGALYVAIVDRSWIVRVPPLWPLATLLLYVVWCVLETANPAIPSLAVAVWGVKAHVLYALCFLVLVPAAFWTVDELLSAIVRFYPFLAIPVCAVALVQVGLPDDHWLNQLPPSSAPIVAHFGEADLVRVSGTFSFITGMSAFSALMTIVGVSLLVLGHRSLFFLLALAMVLLSVPTTGSRSIVAMTVVASALILLTGIAGRLIGASRMVFAIVLASVLSMVAYVGAKDAWHALNDRYQSLREEDEQRALTSFTNAFDHLEAAGLTGFGTGTANQAAPALAPARAPFDWLPNTNFEEESGRLMIELGLVGWVLSMAMRIAFLAWAVSQALFGQTPAQRTAGMLALPFLAIGLHVGTGIYSPPYAAVPFWLFASILIVATHERRELPQGAARLCRRHRFQAALEPPRQSHQR